MKKLLALITLGSAALVSADQYQSNENSCSGCTNGNPYKQQRQTSQAYTQKGNDQKIVSDQDIHKNIQETLSSGWFSKGFQNVSFNVNNGNVDLRGSVDTLENKNKVEDSVKKIDGVKQVNNQITIAKDTANPYSDAELQNSEKKYPQDIAATPQDRQLNAKIRNKLNNGWFSKGNQTLTLNTNNGAVTVTGTVDTLADVQKMSEQFADIQGVKSVKNQLTVKNR